MRADGETRRDYEIRMACEDSFEAWRKLAGNSRCQTPLLKGMTVDSPIGQVTRIYCLNCGVPGGAVTPSLIDAIFICPSCAATHGGLPVPELPAGLITRGA